MIRNLKSSIAGDKRLTVLQVATLNQPVNKDLGYCPIEAVIYNIDKGLRHLGHRSIVACSSDSNVVGEQYSTIERSSGEYCGKDSLQLRESKDINIIHMHAAAMAEYIYKGVLKSPVPIVMTVQVSTMRLIPI